MPAPPEILRRLFARPQHGGWAYGLGAFVVFGAFAAAFGLASGLYTWSPTLDGLWKTALIAIVLPALGEELVFRGPLLAVSEQTAKLAAGPLLALFVLWHPLNAALFLPEARELFYDLRFLANAAALGAACTYATLRARSLWPAIALHWAAVVAWKGLFGGPAFFG
ncbi:MAG: CPBP family glutamic-type intramembrane protease [Pseudomonadota bacterium]